MPCVPDMHQAFLFPEWLERALPSPQGKGFPMRSKFSPFKKKNRVWNDALPTPPQAKTGGSQIGCRRFFGRVVTFSARRTRASARRS